MAPWTRNATPLVFVADMARSIRFYELLGLRVVDTMGEDGRLGWARLQGDGGGLMLVPASHPIRASEQGWLLYLHTDDLAALRAHLQAHGIATPDPVHPEHMPAGELHLADPDGYAVLVGQYGAAEHEAYLRRRAEGDGG